jgi:hypothetical protein
MNDGLASSRTRASPSAECLMGNEFTEWLHRQEVLIVHKIKNGINIVAANLLVWILYALSHPGDSVYLVRGQL